MEIKFDLEKLKKILKIYYKKYEDIDCSININLNIDYDYRGDNSINVFVIQQRNINLVGEKFEVTRIIKIEEIQKILNEILKEQGYEVTHLFYNTEVKQVTTGWGPNEDWNDEAKFNDLTVQIKEIEKAKKYIKE